MIELCRAIAAGEDAQVRKALAADPTLATRLLEVGATRGDPTDYFLNPILHYVYAGDTLLHVAGAAYRAALVPLLVAAGADVAAANRRGASPLHYAADGGPGAPHWDPPAQVRTIEALLAAGAPVDAIDAGSVTPLHRAIRCRCSAAVAALLAGGADPKRPNAKGTRPIQLAKLTTGKSGSGEPAARAEQVEILRLLEKHGG